MKKGLLPIGLLVLGFMFISCEQPTNETSEAETINNLCRFCFNPLYFYDFRFFEYIRYDKNGKLYPARYLE